MEARKVLELLDDRLGDYFYLVIDGEAYDNHKTYPMETIEFMLVCGRDGIDYIYYFYQNTVYGVNLSPLNDDRFLLPYIKAIPDYEERLMKHDLSTVMKVKHMMVIAGRNKENHETVMKAISGV